MHGGDRDTAVPGGAAVPAQGSDLSRFCGTQSRRHTGPAGPGRKAPSPSPARSETSWSLGLPHQDTPSPRVLPGVKRNLKSARTLKYLSGGELCVFRVTAISLINGSCKGAVLTGMKPRTSLSRGGPGAPPVGNGPQAQGEAAGVGRAGSTAQREVLILEEQPCPGFQGGAGQPHRYFPRWPACPVISLPA